MKAIKNISFSLLILISPLVAFGQGAPPPPESQGANGNQESRSAPIGGGIAMLLTMGAAYGGKKYYDYRKKMQNEMEE